MRVSSHGSGAPIRGSRRGHEMVGQTTVGGRVARVVVLAAVLGLVGTGSASAAPVTLGNAAFTRAGVKVYAEGAVGLGCQTFGFCNGVAADLAGSARPQYVSTRPGEAVRVTCRL